MFIWTGVPYSLRITCITTHSRTTETSKLTRGGVSASISSLSCVMHEGKCCFLSILPVSTHKSSLRQQEQCSRSFSSFRHFFFFFPAAGFASTHPSQEAKNVSVRVTAASAESKIYTFISHFKRAHAEDKWLMEVEICAGGRLSAAMALTTDSKDSGGEMCRHVISQASEAVLPFCVQTCDVLTAGGLLQVPEPQAEIGSVWIVSQGTPKKPVAGIDGGDFTRLPDLCALSESRSLELNYSKRVLKQLRLVFVHVDVTAEFIRLVQKPSAVRSDLYSLLRLVDWPLAVQIV